MCTYTRQFIKINSMMSIKWEENTSEGHDVVPVDLIELLLTWCLVLVIWFVMLKHYNDVKSFCFHVKKKIHWMKF